MTMVTKRKRSSETEETKGKVKVEKLKVNRETVKDLTGREEKRIKGGAFPISISACWCTGTLNDEKSCRNCI